MEFSEKLIEMIKNYPILFNSEHPDYKNIRKKEKIWNAIGLALEENGVEVKRKWKNLRDSYTKYLKSARSKAGKSTKKNYVNWQWAKHMEPFLPYMRYARTFANTPDTNLEENDDFGQEFIKMEQSLVLEDSSNVDEHQHPQITEQLPVTTTSSENHNEFGGRRVINQNETRVPSSSFAILEHLQDMDPTELIFLGYAKTLKSFSLKRQAVTKMKIAQIIMEQELQHQEELSTALQNQTDPLSPNGEYFANSH